MLCTMNTNLKVKGPSPGSIRFFLSFFPPLFSPFILHHSSKDMLDMKSVECRTFDIIAFRSKSISASKSRCETLRKHWTTPDKTEHGFRKKKKQQNLFNDGQCGGWTRENHKTVTSVSQQSTISKNLGKGGWGKVYQQTCTKLWHSTNGLPMRKA